MGLIRMTKIDITDKIYVDDLRSLEMVCIDMFDEIGYIKFF